LDNLLATYRRAADGTCTICANGQSSLIRNRLQDAHSTDVGVGFFEDGLPIGPAGCLKACEARLTGRTILIVGGSAYFEDDPNDLCEAHRRSGNALTVFCKPDGGARAPSGALMMRPAGLYCCEPSVLRFIGSRGYRDIKEQLIPALQRAELRVGAIPLRQPAYEVSDWSSYMSVVGRVLSAGRFPTDGYRNLAPQVWCGEGVELSAKARIVGPALLGHLSRIEDDAVVIGPTTFGSECHIGGGSWLVRVVGGDRMRCPANSSLADRFVPDFALAPSTQRAAHAAVVDACWR
jgi:NDP-sugar pyrophosphorylase family protein